MKNHIGNFAAVRNKLMMFLALLLPLMIIAQFNALAQYPGYRVISDVSQFTNKFKEASTNVHSIQGDFRQTKTLSALTEEITSTGKIWFKRSGRVRMDYISPFAYKLVINNDKMLIRDGDKENRINTKSNKLFQQINRITIDCMQGTILESQDFKSKVFENETSYLLELKPTSKTLKDFFETIVLVIDKNDLSAKSIELNEFSGDKTLLTFSNKIINGQVSDELFSF